jgi:amyloid beta precursor protein binding protein 1
MVRAGARASNPEGAEENFDEAVGAVLKSIQPPSVPSTVREIFGLEPCVNLSRGSPSFWIIASAVKEFARAHGVLPLPGAVPDMKAESTVYIALQNIYKAKARQDVAEVADAVRAIEARLDRETPIPESEIEQFCKNAAHLKVIFSSPHPPLHALSETDAKKLAGHLINPESLFSVFLAFRVYDEICNKVGGQSVSSPSTEEVHLDECRNGLEAALSRIKSAAKIQAFDDDEGDELLSERLQSICQELQRARGGELHNTAALTGGMVAQEAIKVVTRQYVPVDNTCIFDGVTSRSEVLKL